MKRLLAGLLCMVFLGGLSATALAAELTCWFPPGWKKDKSAKAKEITDGLTRKSGITVRPGFAYSYPQILEAFASGEPCLVYVGSFVQAIIRERGIGEPLVQAITGKEFYGSWMIFKQGQSPEDILRKSPTKIAFASGASSGESGAMAATGGKASVRLTNHGAAARAVMVGAAEAGFVKNWWWLDNKGKFPELDVYQVPGVSDLKNPDNVLSASNSVSAADRKRITRAAQGMAEVFGAQEMAPFDKANLDFSVNLMKKGRIDPRNYNW